MHQHLLHLGLENVLSHHYLYQKTFHNYFSLIFQIWGTLLHCTSDRPCQLIIFPIEKSLHEFFFFKFFWCTIFFSVSSARFLFFFNGLRENFLNDLESDPTNETDLNEHSLSVEIMKSTDNKETVIKLSKFIFLCFEKRSKRLEARNADSQ